MLSYYHTLFELFLWASRFLVHPCEVFCNPFWQHPLIVLYHTQLLNFLVSTQFSCSAICMWSSLHPNTTSNVKALLYAVLKLFLWVNVSFTHVKFFATIMTLSNQFALPYPDTKHPSEHPVFLSTHVKFFATRYDIIQPICFTIPWYKTSQWTSSFLVHPCEVLCNHYDMQPICLTIPWYKTSQWASSSLLHPCEVLCNSLWHHATNLLDHTLIQNIPVSIQFSCPPMWSSLQPIMTSSNQFALPYPDTKHPSELPVLLSTHVKFFTTYYDIQPICFAIPWYKTSQWASSFLVHSCEVLCSSLWYQPTNLLNHTLIQNISGEHPVFLAIHVKFFATHYDIIQPICFTIPWYKTSQWTSSFLGHTCEVLCNPLWHPTNLLYHTLIQNIPVSIQFSWPSMWSSLQPFWKYPTNIHYDSVIWNFSYEHTVFLCPN